MIKSRIWEMKGGRFANIVAKIQLSAIFICKLLAEKWSTQLYRALYGDAMLVSIRMNTIIAAGNQQKIKVIL